MIWEVVNRRIQTRQRGDASVKWVGCKCLITVVQSQHFIWRGNDEIRMIDRLLQNVKSAHSRSAVTWMDTCKRRWHSVSNNKTSWLIQSCENCIEWMGNCGCVEVHNMVFRERCASVRTFHPLFHSSSRWRALAVHCVTYCLSIGNGPLQRCAKRKSVGRWKSNVTQLIMSSSYH